MEVDGLFRLVGEVASSVFLVNSGNLRSLDAWTLMDTHSKHQPAECNTSEVNSGNQRFQVDDLKRSSREISGQTSWRL
jgi:hypothetical protein